MKKSFYVVRGVVYNYMKAFFEEDFDSVGELNQFVSIDDILNFPTTIGELRVSKGDKTRMKVYDLFVQCPYFVDIHVAEILRCSSSFVGIKRRELENRKFLLKRKKGHSNVDYDSIDKALLGNDPYNLIAERFNVSGTTVSERADYLTSRGYDIPVRLIGRKTEALGLDEKIIPLLGKGLSDYAIARSVGVNPKTVAKRRRRK